MKDNLDHIDNIFKEGLENLTVTPPPAAWDNIGAQVHKKKVLPLILKRISAAAAILILAFAVFVKTDFRKKTNAADNVAATTENANTDNHIILNKVPETAVLAKTEQTNNKPGLKTETPKRNEQTNPPVDKKNKLFAEVKSTIGIPISTDSFQNKTTKLKELNPKTNRLLAQTEAPKLLKAGNAASDEQEAVIRHNLAMADTYEDFTSVNKDKMAFSLSGQASPILASVETVEKMQESNFLFTESKPETQNKDMSAYSAGLSFSIDKGGRFSVKAGVMYTQMGTVSQQSDLYEMGTELREIAMNTSSDKIVSTQNASLNAYVPAASEKQTAMPMPVSMNVQTLSTYEISESLEYIEVPLIVSYKLIDRKLDFNLSGGLATNFPVGSAVMSGDAGGGIDNTVDISEVVEKVRFATNFGIGIEYPIFDKFTLSVEPTLKYYLPTGSETQISQLKPFAMGFYTGINYRF